MKNNIPQGYKATALGIIPQEWEIFDFDEIVEKSKERYIPNPDTHLYCIELEHLSQGEGTLIGYTDSAEQKSTKNRFQNGDVLFGKLRPYLQKYWLATFDGVCSTEIWVFHAKPNICLKEYLLRIISSYNFIQKANVSSGSKMPRAEWDYVSKIPVLVPPLAEQRKIAEVLGVWDEAIEKQARLIEKLALRKRALMQRLLSAKLRLPGFSEPWKTHKLQELFTERNETNRTDLPLLSITGDRGVILQTESEKRDTSNDDKSKYKRIAKGDIGYNTMRMWQGRSALSGLEGIVSPAYTIVVPNTTDVDGYYMSVLFKQPRLVYDFWTHSQGLVGDTLNCKYRDFGQVHICCPPLAEQKAITEVLTTADREIELAKEKLERLRSQKRGLMQQLLTGKKRVKY